MNPIKTAYIFMKSFVTGAFHEPLSRSNVSQPAASKMLANFRREIGINCLFRNNGKLIPTMKRFICMAKFMVLLQASIIF